MFAIFSKDRQTGDRSSVGHRRTVRFLNWSRALVYLLVRSANDAVCGFEYKNAVDGSESESRAFPIAGLEHLGQGSKDPEVTRLKKIDPDREGLMVRLAGGQYIDENKAKKDAAAVIEFQCDHTRSGLEGLDTTDESDQEAEEKRLRAREEISARTPSLQFKSFGPSDNNSYVLKLDWLTRYACDDYLSGKKGDSSGAWGFFTWFIVMYVSPLVSIIMP